MKDSEFDALLRSALLEAARLDAEALTEGEPEAPPRSLEYQAEMAALLRDPRKRPETFEDLKVLQAKIREICTHTY